MQVLAFFYDISLIKGYTYPLSIEFVGGGAACTNSGCKGHGVYPHCDDDGSGTASAGKGQALTITFCPNGPVPSTKEYCPSAGSTKKTGVVVQPLTTIEITNLLPQIEGGATIYDGLPAYHSISVFGLGCSAGGCVLMHGSSQEFSSGSTEFGIQWNINRLAPDGATCDNPCSQYELDVAGCTVSHVSGGMCSAKTTPSWTANVEATFSGGKCSLKVIGGSVTSNADRCSCAYGAMPCHVGDGVCQAVCPPGVLPCPEGAADGCRCFETLEI